MSEAERISRAEELLVDEKKARQVILTLFEVILVGR